MKKGSKRVYVGPRTLPNLDKLVLGPFLIWLSPSSDLSHFRAVRPRTSVATSTFFSVRTISDHFRLFLTLFRPFPRHFTCFSMFSEPNFVDLSSDLIDFRGFRPRTLSIFDVFRPRTSSDFDLFVLGPWPKLGTSSSDLADFG